MKRPILVGLQFLAALAMATGASCARKPVWCKITVKSIQVSPDGRVMISEVANMGDGSKLLTNFDDGPVSKNVGIMVGQNLETGDTGQGSVAIFLPLELLKKRPEGGGSLTSDSIFLHAGETYQMDSSRPTLPIFEYATKDGVIHRGYFRLERE